MGKKCHQKQEIRVAQGGKKLDFHSEFADAGEHISQGTRVLQGRNTGLWSSQKWQSRLQAGNSLLLGMFFRIIKKKFTGETYLNVSFPIYSIILLLFYLPRNKAVSGPVRATLPLHLSAIPGAAPFLSAEVQRKEHLFWPSPRPGQPNIGLMLLLNRKNCRSRGLLHRWMLPAYSKAPPVAGKERAHHCSYLQD